MLNLWYCMGSYYMGYGAKCWDVVKYNGTINQSQIQWKMSLADYRIRNSFGTLAVIWTKVYR